MLAIAGVRPVDKDERQLDSDDTNQSAIVVSVNIGGVPAPEPVDVIEGQARVVDEARVPMSADTGTLVLIDQATGG